MNDYHSERSTVDTTIERVDGVKDGRTEETVYLTESETKNIPLGWTSCDKFPYLTIRKDKMNEEEQDERLRRPIPYAIIKYKKYCYIVNAEKSNGEGRTSFLHALVNPQDLDELSLSKTILKSLERELELEGITLELIKSIELKGLLKLDNDEDADYLGFVYQIILSNKDIPSEESHKGIWIHEKDIQKHEEAFGAGAKVIYERLIK